MTLLEHPTEADRLLEEEIRRATGSHRTGKEICRLGQEIYDRDIRHLVEADHHEEDVVIDVDSGCWEVDECGIAAAERLRAKHPDARDLFGIRVGHPTLAYFGYHPPRIAA